MFSFLAFFNCARWKFIVSPIELQRKLRFNFMGLTIIFFRCAENKNPKKNSKMLKMFSKNAERSRTANEQQSLISTCPKYELRQI